jgi:predicted transcriptional regulator
MRTPATTRGHQFLTHVSARLSEPERSRLDAIASASDRTTSAVVRRAIRAYIDHFLQIEELLDQKAQLAREDRRTPDA